MKYDKFSARWIKNKDEMFPCACAQIQTHSPRYLWPEDLNLGRADRWRENFPVVRTIYFLII